MDERLFAQIVRGARERRRPDLTLRMSDTDPVLSQSALAERCGVSQGWVSHRESGEAEGNEGVLENTAQGLGISVRRLLLEELDPDRAALEAAEGEPPGCPSSRVLSWILRQHVEHRRLSYRALVPLLGVSSTSAVSAYLAGTQLQSEKKMQAFAAAWGMPLRQLLLDGLLLGPRERTDLGAMRKRLAAAVEKRRLVLARVTDELGVHRSRLTRFLDGAGLLEETAQKLATWLDGFDRMTDAEAAEKLLVHGVKSAPPQIDPEAQAKIHEAVREGMAARKRPRRPKVSE